MTHDLDQIKSRLDLRHVAHDLNLVPKRFASAFSARVRFHCPSPRHPNGDTKGDLSVACDHFVCHWANCGAKGDVFDLLALVHDLDRDAHFSQLVVDAAHRAGVDLPSSSGLIPARSPARPPRPNLCVRPPHPNLCACPRLPFASRVGTQDLEKQNAHGLISHERFCFKYNRQ